MKPWRIIKPGEAFVLILCGAALGLFFVWVERALGLSKSAMSIILLTLCVVLLGRMFLLLAEYARRAREEDDDF